MSNGAKAWFPDFKAKEPMFHDGGRPHAEEVFTVPDRLFNGDVLFPTKVMGSFVKLVGLKMSPGLLICELAVIFWI